MRSRSFSVGLVLLGTTAVACTAARDRARADSVAAINQQQGLLLATLTAQRDSIAHVARAEMGAHGALLGVTMRTWTSERGRLRAATVESMLALDCGPHLVETACVAVEDSSNFGGGTVQDLGELTALSAILRASGVASHLDGARLANAAAVSGRPLAEHGRLFDTVASWEHALASALAARGEADAEVLAAVGIAVFRAATAAWVRDGGDLGALVVAGFDALGSSA